MRGGDGQNYPDKDDPVEQEAVRFLFSDFTSEKGHNASDDEHLHAGPMIREITDEERLHTWIEIAKEYPDRVVKADRDALRQRLRELSVEEDVEFERASEIDEPSVDAESEAAVADGGAVVEEDSETNSGVSQDDGVGDRELGPGQEWAEYADEAEFESEKNDIRGFVFSDSYATVDDVQEALDDEFDRDVVRRHIVELLEERLEELDG